MSHEYVAQLMWDGNLGEGTSSYTTYGRQYRVTIEGKPDLSGSANPAFRGEADKHDPEDLFLASITACHMLSYLALCARQRISVVAYEDRARGLLVLDSRGRGKFEEITLTPSVTIAHAEDAEVALQLHETAHELCFIANSCKVPIRVEATIRDRDRVVARPEGVLGA